MGYRRPTTCAEYARTGGHDDSGAEVWCFRKRAMVAADGGCAQGIPIKTGSQRFKRASGNA